MLHALNKNLQGLCQKRCEFTEFGYFGQGFYSSHTVSAQCLNSCPDYFKLAGDKPFCLSSYISDSF